MLQAQSVWYGREKGNSINLEINKPFIPSFNLGSSEVGFDAWSSSYFLSGRYSLKNNKNITFVADIPFVHGFIDDPIVLNGSEWALGNPYLGAEFDIPKTPVYFELGFRFPLFPDDKGVAEITGVLSDFDRSEAFYQNLFPVYGSVNYETVSDNKILFKVRGGLNFWFSSDTANVESDPAVRADYEFQTGYIDKNLNIILSLVGREDLSANATIKQKFNLFQYGLSIIVPYKKIRPAISFRFPGNDRAKSVLNYVVGLNFGYVF